MCLHRRSVQHSRNGLIRLVARLLHVADPLVQHREVALPAGVARVRPGQAAEDVVRSLAARQRRRQVALDLAEGNGAALTKDQDLPR